MTLYTTKAIFKSFSYEFFLQLFTRKSEGYVHKGAAILICVALVEAVTAIDYTVYQICLFLVDLGKSLKTTLGLNPLCGLSHHINAESWWSVIK